MSRRRRVTIGVAIVLTVAGLLLSAGAAAEVARNQERYAGQLMNRYVHDVTTTVTDRASRYEEAMIDTAAALGAQSELSRGDFQAVTAGLSARRLPGAGRIGFVVPADTRGIATVQQRWRAAGQRDLRLRPAGGQPEHAFIIFERLLDAGPSQAGFDLTGIPSARDVLDVARRTASPAVSAAHALAVDQDRAPAHRQPAVTFAVPVVTGQGNPTPDVFVGWVVMAVRGDDFLDQILYDRTRGAVQVALADGRDTTITEITPGQPLRDRALTRAATVTVAQSRWTLVVSPTSGLMTSIDRRLGLLTLCGGGALTLLSTALFTVLSTSRSNALERVERATAELRRDIGRRQVVEARLRDREQQLRHLAYHDSLTGAANRPMFEERVGAALPDHAAGGLLLAVMFVDLDGFKQVNDRLGHAAGDHVLREVTTRLRQGLRSGDTVARFGGDEFAVLVERLATVDHARTTAERIVDVVRQAIDIGDEQVRVTASIGIATNRPGDDADEIMRQADKAMYAAKRAGKSRFVFAP